MADETRSGVVTDISFPKPGKGKCKVGGKAVNYWLKEYQSEEQSAVSVAIDAAFQSGEPIVLGGDIWVGTGSDGKEFRMFTAKYVADANTPSNGNGSVDTSGIASAEIVNLLRAILKAQSMGVALIAKSIDADVSSVEGEAKFVADLSASI